MRASVRGGKKKKGRGGGQGGPKDHSLTNHQRLRAADMQRYAKTPGPFTSHMARASAVALHPRAAIGGSNRRGTWTRQGLDGSSCPVRCQQRLSLAQLITHCHLVLVQW
jgi:hypothetical protein